ncbi:hypothetical protein ACFWY5_46725, partial [Nonomuraea sp. NPDC059007]|uniref:hypothetical protein n=1 Tax=Nonomuraea sp. NPDC059007 TaxID=3346692 RepID=UPI003679978B
ANTTPRKIADLQHGSDWQVITWRHHRLRARAVHTGRTRARPYRGIGQSSPSQAEAGPPSPADLASHQVHRRTILGGLINEYRIAN